MGIERDLQKELESVNLGLKSNFIQQLCDFWFSDKLLLMKQTYATHNTFKFK